MNNILVEQKAPISEAVPLVRCLLELCHRFNLVPIPLKPKSKVPLVRWSDERWKPSPVELEIWAQKPDVNWGVRCGESLAVIDCDSEDAYFGFITTYELPPDCPVVKTGRGYHIWVKPKKPIRSQRVDNVEIKCLGSYIVAPPSIHPSGVPYIFQVPLNGALPEVDLDALFNLQSNDTGSNRRSPTNFNTPSDFALRYGKSPYPQSLCGRATKVLTRSDGEVKHLLSLRCWKWNCPKCAAPLKRYWLDKLAGISFRFILRLPTMDKPTVLLRRAGKPSYVHIVANGKGWLFLADGDAEKVWIEARMAGYELVAGDISGTPSLQDVEEYLEQALCREEEPLNTRRKISHSRGLFKKIPESNNGNESKQKGDCSEEKEDMNASRREPHTWDSEVVMKSIEEVAKELEAQGWKIIWQSEVDALAVKGDAARVEDVDIVELIENRGVKLKKVGEEYKGLCPFHDDRDPSLSVNKEKGLWHCFGCGRGGDVQQFVEKWQGMRWPPKDTTG